MLAAALGATVRLGLSLGLERIGGAAFLPWAVFSANILGCFLFGVCWVYLQHHKRDARAVLVGFMGSLTTFSSYAYDIYLFILDKAWGFLALYAFAQIAIALLFVHLGIKGMQRYFASK